MFICINRFGHPYDAYNVENTSFVTDGEVIDIIRAGKVYRHDCKMYSVELVRSDVRTLTNMGYIVAL